MAIYTPEILDVFKPLNEEIVVSYNINSWLKDREIESIVFSGYDKEKIILSNEDLNKVITVSKCSFDKYWILFYLPQNEDESFLEDKTFFVFAFVTTNDGLKKNFAIRINFVDFKDQVIV